MPGRLFFKLNGRELLVQFAVRFGPVLWILPPDPETPPPGTTQGSKENISQRPTPQETTRKKIERDQARDDGRKI